MAKQKKYFGQSLGFWAVAAVVLYFVASSAGWIPDDLLSSDAESIGTASGTFSLDSTFVSVISDNNTMADTTNNYDEDTGVVTMPIYATVSDDGTDTTFVLSTKNTAGTEVELLNFTETGAVVTTPTVDQTIEVLCSISESLESGISSTESAEWATIEATTAALVDSTGDEFYPIAVRSNDADNPAVYVDSSLDDKEYAWLLSTEDQIIEVSFDISMAGVIAMDDLDKFTVDINLENADQDNIVLEFIKLP